MNADIELTVSDSENREVVTFIQEHLAAHNIASARLEIWHALTALVRDSQGQIIAGLIAELWGGCLELRYLWVHEEWRGCGYGARLLAAAEMEALSHDCVQVVVDTFSFQAPAFYEKHGYTVCGVVEDFPQGFCKYMLTKRLR